MVVAAGLAHGDLGDQLFKLLPDDWEINAEFGHAVEMDSTHIIVGAPGFRGHGKAYLFDAAGNQLFVLEASDRDTGRLYGDAVAILGANAIIGDPNADVNGVKNSGAAYVIDTATGRERFRLLPAETHAYHGFGSGVAVNDQVALIGAPGDMANGSRSGAVYVFDLVTGEEISKLFPDDGDESDFFGVSVAIHGDLAVVGAPGDDDNGDRSGSVYIFSFATGQQLYKLIPNDGEEDESFGVSVAFNSAFVLVGAENDDHNGHRSGSAYLFDVKTGHQLYKLLPDDGEFDAWFGGSVALDGTTGIVGAARAARASGNAYLYDLTTGRQILRLRAGDPAEDDRFGSSVAISSLGALVGAHNDDEQAQDAGAAYLFDTGQSDAMPAVLTSVAIQTGTLLTGGLPDLDSSDDSYLHTRSGVGTSLFDVHHMEMHIDANTGVPSPVTLDLTIESRIDEPAGIAQIRLRDWDAGTFTYLGQYPIGASDESTTLRNIAAADFISPDGDIRLSIKHIVFAPFVKFDFESWFDHVEIRVR